MSELVYFTSIGMVLGTILIVFGMKYFASAAQTRNSTAREDAYRALAEKSTTVLAAVQTEMADVKTRLASVETILKAVE
jgi:hypothetical protein